MLPQGCPPKRLVKAQNVENLVVSVLLHSEVLSLNRFFFLPPPGGWGGMGEGNCGPFLVLGAGNEQDTGEELVGLVIPTPAAQSVCLGTSALSARERN